MRRGFDTTKRRFGRLRRKFLFTATSPLKACRFIVAVLPVVVENNRFKAKLTGCDPPAAAESLKLLFAFNADSDLEALHKLKRIVNVSHRVVATNDNNGPA